MKLLKKKNLIEKLNVIPHVNSDPRTRSDIWASAVRTAASVYHSGWGLDGDVRIVRAHTHIHKNLSSLDINIQNILCVYVAAVVIR